MKIFDGQVCPHCCSQPRWQFWGQEVLASWGLLKSKATLLILATLLVPLIFLPFRWIDGDATMTWVLTGVITIVFVVSRFVPLFFCPNCSRYANADAIGKAVPKKHDDGQG